MFRQEVELSDDDAEIAIEKVVDKSINSKTSEIERLIELREQIRVSRLHPDAVRSVLSLMAFLYRFQRKQPIFAIFNWLAY